MTKKITLTINGSRFDIDVEAKFAEFLETQIAGDFNPDGNNSFKTLLQAYVRKNYELYELEAQLHSLEARCDALRGVVKGSTSL